jgi:hypothetical protein
METAVLGLRHDTQQMRSAIVSLPEMHQQINDNLRSLHTLLGGTHKALLTEQKHIGAHLAEASRHQKAFSEQVANDSKINAHLANTLESLMSDIRNDARETRSAVAVLPEMHQQVNSNLHSLHTLLGGTHEAMLVEQKRISVHLAESTRQQSANVSSIDRLVESYAAIVTLQGRIVEVIQTIADADHDQSSSLEMIIQIQNDLQNQMNGENFLKDVFIENKRMKI